MKSIKHLQQIEPNPSVTDPVGVTQKILINGKEVNPDSSVNPQKLKEQMDRNPEIWETMFRILESTTFSSLVPGRYEVMGENLFYMVNQYVTKKAESVKFEAHRKYIDLQYVTEGEEMMGVSGFGNATETETYMAENDIAFYTVPKAEYHTATPDVFFVFLPEDVHQPGVKVNDPREVRKVVFKILII
jgi:biofilm protein TabA